MQDTLNRRLRFASPQPSNERIILNESDVTVFETIHRHGPLPSNYLFAFTERENFNHFQHRLTKLYNGGAQASFLVRPPQQFASFHARYSPIVYDLNEQSKALIALSPFINRADPFVHRLMGACVGASIELACRKKGLRYISRHEVLSKKGRPMELPLSQFAPQKTLVPDDLFGINYGGAYRRFAVEIDRNTESIERRKIDQNTFGKKLACYLDAMRRQTYKDIWGIPGMMVLIITTNEAHMQNMMAYLTTLDLKLAERFLFKTLSTFGANWRVPPILTDILDPWHSVVGTFDITKSAP